MIGITKLSILALLSSIITAAPVTNQKRACPSSIWDAQTLLKIAPTANSCSAAPYPDECATAEHAAPFINKSFTKYGVTNVYEQAALISIMIFETGSFVYDKNHFPAPGTPGKGTRNMQSPTFNLKYAQAVIPPAQLTPVQSDPASVLALLLGDDLSFASAAWFLTTQCTTAQRAALQTGSLDGWHGYLTNCVGTSLDDKRDAGWNLAIAQVKAKGQ